MNPFPDNVSVKLSGISGGVKYYSVRVDGREIGTVWQVPWQTFAGRWRGWMDDDYGHTIDYRHTRMEVVDAMLCSHFKCDITAGNHHCGNPDTSLKLPSDQDIPVSGLETDQGICEFSQVDGIDSHDILDMTEEVPRRER